MMYGGTFLEVTQTYTDTHSLVLRRPTHTHIYTHTCVYVDVPNLTLLTYMVFIPKIQIIFKINLKEGTPGSNFFHQ